MAEQKFDMNAWAERAQKTQEKLASVVEKMVKPGVVLSMEGQAILLTIETVLEAVEILPHVIYGFHTIDTRVQKLERLLASEMLIKSRIKGGSKR
jgi:hypothetical protein